MRALVTGDQGFIGSHLKTRLRDLGFEVTGRDLTNGRSCQSLDTDDLQGVDTVFHLAAWNNIKYSMRNPYRWLSNNIESTNRVLGITSTLKNPPRIILASSSSVHSVPKGLASPYAVSKLCTEWMARSYSYATGLKTISLRFFNVFGPNQNCYSSYSPVIARWLHLAKNNLPIVLYGDGEQRRDFTYVDNVVDAMLLASECEMREDNYTMDIGGGKSVTLNEIIEHLKKHYPNLRVTQEPAREVDARDSRAKMADSGFVLDYKPRVSVFDGIDKLAGGYV